MVTSAKRRFKAHNYPNASLVKRVMAMVYDSLLVLAVWMLVGYIAIAFNDGQAVKGPWFNSILFVVTYGFFALFWVRSGQTLGMLAWCLRVEDNDGYVLTLKQALVRYLSAFIALGSGIGYLWIIFSKDKLAWHDSWSNTRIVQLPKREKK